MKPDFGVDDDKIESRLRGNVISYGPSFDNLINGLKDSIKGFTQSDIPVKTFLTVRSRPSCSTEAKAQARPL